MALSETEKNLFNELFRSATFTPDPATALADAGASDAVMRSLLNSMRQKARSRAERVRDDALSKLARINA